MFKAIVSEHSGKGLEVIDVDGFKLVVESYGKKKIKWPLL